MKCGRYKLTGVSAEVGPPWGYCDDGTDPMGDRAGYLLGRGPCNHRGKYCSDVESYIACRRNDGQVVIMHIKAVNSVAIKAFREAKIPFRTTDPEGDDQVISDDIRRAEREHEDAQIEVAKAAAQASRMQVSRDAKAFAEAAAKSSCQKREHAMSRHCPRSRAGLATPPFYPWES